MKSGVFYRLIKRLFDICASIVAIFVSIPILLITSIGIVISDPGPVLYFSNRVTKDNRTFKMYKFRSMRVDKKANEKSLRPDQGRIFPFGRFLRATKIDELPQLINILLGDMSIVGPRPASIDQIIITRGGENSIVACAKAGLTSPAALYDYLYGDDIEDEEEYMEKVAPTRLALDRYYVCNQSLCYDIKLIWYTVLCIFSKIFKYQQERLLAKIIGVIRNNNCTF